MTDRDYLLLKSLYDFKLLSFSQIARLHFRSNAKPTIVNRLSKLEKVGFISKYKVPRLYVLKQETLVSVVYQITRLGISVLQRRLCDLELWREPLKLQPFSIDHDLLLVDVLCALKSQEKNLKVVLGEHFLRTTGTQSLKPDAVIFKKDSLKPTALELELTVKSDRRYQDLILKYRLSSDFESVLYVTAFPQIEAKIKSVLGPTDLFGRFQFLKLDDVLKTKSGSNFILDQVSKERKEV